MQLVLFRPFDLNKWLVIGFASFLSTCGEGGGGATDVLRLAQNLPELTSQRSAGGQPFGDAFNGLMENLPFVIGLVVGFFITFMVLGIFLAWVNARGDFVFLDNVARNRAAIGEPWNEYAREGNSLFGFNLVMGLSSLGTIAVLGVIAYLLAAHDIEHRHFGTGAAAAAALLVLVGLPVLLILGMIQWVMQSWGVPLMYIRRIGAFSAARAAFSELVVAQPLAVCFFGLLQMVLAVVIALVVFFIICCTCCLGALPYVSSVVTLPVMVFQRAFSVFFLEQLGPSYQLIQVPRQDHLVETFR